MEKTSIWTTITQSLAEKFWTLLQDAGHLLWSLIITVIILILAKIALQMVTKFTGHIIQKQ